MPSHSAQLPKLEQIVVPVCLAHGVTLVDARLVPERGGAVLRVLIDRDRGPAEEWDGSGVSLDDCTAVSRDLSAALDVHEDLLPAGYRLEVSSPGLERPLVTLADFERFAGREARVRTRERIGDRRQFHGTLLGVEEGAVRIEDGGSVLSIPHELITRANLVYRF